MRKMGKSEAVPERCLCCTALMSPAVQVPGGFTGSRAALRMLMNIFLFHFSMTFTNTYDNGACFIGSE